MKLKSDSASAGRLRAGWLGSEEAEEAAPGAVHQGIVNFGNFFRVGNDVLAPET